MGGFGGRLGLVAAALALGVGLVACGGSAPGSAAPPAATATAGSGASDPGTGSATSPDAVPTDAAQTDPGAASPAAGGTGKVCDLATADEIAAVLGSGTLVQGYYPGPPDTCDFRADNLPVVAFSLVEAGQGGGLVYDAIKADSTSQEFTGIGDRALYNSGMQSFLVLKGDRLVTILVSASDLDDAQRIEKLKAIGEIVAGRL